MPSQLLTSLRHSHRSILGLRLPVATGSLTVTLPSIFEIRIKTAELSYRSQTRLW